MTIVRSAAPRHVARRYLTGECDILAIEAAKKTGFELWAMRNGRGTPEHIFVRDPASGLALDIRGAMPLEDIPKGSSLDGRAPALGPITPEEIETVMGVADPVDARAARKVFRDYLARIADRMPGLAPSEEVSPDPS